jgi:hypothetical protein
MECISDAYNHFVRTVRRNITSAMCCADTAVVFSNFQIVPPFQFPLQLLPTVKRTWQFL